MVGRVEASELSYIMRALLKEAAILDSRVVQHVDDPVVAREVLAIATSLRTKAHLIGRLVE